MGTAGGTGGFRAPARRRHVRRGERRRPHRRRPPAFVAAHRAHGGIATIAVKQVDDPSHYGVVVHDEQGRVTGFQEKPARDEARSHLCNCGIYAFEPAIFDYIPPGAVRRLRQGRLPGAAGRRACRSTCGALDTYWNDVGSLSEYRRGNFDALAGRVAARHAGSRAAPGRVGRRGHARSADDVEIVPPVLIGDGCRVAAGARLVGPLVDRRRLHDRPRRRARGRHPLERHRDRPPGVAWRAASWVATSRSATTPWCTRAR